MVPYNEAQNERTEHGFPAESGLEIRVRRITNGELNEKSGGLDEKEPSAETLPRRRRHADLNPNIYLPGLQFDFYIASKLNERDANTGEITGGDRIYLHDEWMKLVRPSFSEKLYKGKTLEFSGSSELPTGFFISDLSLSDRQVLDLYEKHFAETFDSESDSRAGHIGPEFFAKMNDLLHAWKKASQPALTAALQYLYAEPTGLLYYLNAGSPVPLHFSADEEKIVQDKEFSKSLPLGFFGSDEAYSSNGKLPSNFRQKMKGNACYLSPGDIFIMASDGFSEGTYSSPLQRKGERRSNYLSPGHVEEIIMRNKDASPLEIGKILVGEVEKLNMKSDYSIIILKRPEDAVVTRETLENLFPKNTGYTRRMFTTK